MLPLQGVMGSIPGRGTKIQNALWCSQKNKNLINYFWLPIFRIKPNSLAKRPMLLFFKGEEKKCVCEPALQDGQLRREASRQKAAWGGQCSPPDSVPPGQRCSWALASLLKAFLCSGPNVNKK